MFEALQPEALLSERNGGPQRSVGGYTIVSVMAPYGQQGRVAAHFRSLWQALAVRSERQGRSYFG